MKKRVLYFFILLSAAAQAQNVKIGASAGMNYFTLNSFFGESISLNGFGLDREPSYGVNAKYEVSNTPLSLTGQFSYSPLNSEGSRYFILGSNDPAANTIDPRQHVKISSDLYMLGLGAEYRFYKNEILSFYFGAHITGAYFGSFYFQFSDALGRRGDVLGGFYRLGAGFGPGVEIKTFSKLYLNISAEFNYYNLAGKEKYIYAYDYDGGKANVEEDYIPGIALSAAFMWAL